MRKTELIEHIEDLVATLDEIISERDDLLRELEARFAQTKCGCGHPKCNRCKDDAQTQAVIDRARGEATTEEHIEVCNETTP